VKQCNPELICAFRWFIFVFHVENARSKKKNRTLHVTFKEKQYPLYRRMGGPQGRSGHVRKISPPPGFDPRTVEPIASRYTILSHLQCLRYGYIHDVTFVAQFFKSDINCL